MPSYKITLFYNQFTQGFTETWYATGSYTAGTFGLPVMQDFFKAADDLRSPSCVLVAARWSQIGAPRNSFTKFFGAKFASTLSPSSSAPDLSAEDALVQIYATNGAKRHIYFRGLSAVNTPRNPVDGLPQPTAYLLNAINQYLFAAYQAQLAIQVQVTTVANPALPSTTVFSVIANPGNPEQSICSLSNPPTWVGGSPLYARFSRIPKNNLPGFPRTCEVQGVSAGPPYQITIPYRFRAGTAIFAPQNMQFTQLLYTYPILLSPSNVDYSVQLVNFTERKTGRAFFVPRGRASTVITRK